MQDRSSCAECERVSSSPKVSPGIASDRVVLLPFGMSRRADASRLFPIHARRKHVLETCRTRHTKPM